MKRLTVLLLLAGLAAATALIAWQGLGTIAQALAAGGWPLLWLIPLFVPPLLAAALAWWWLFAPPGRPSLGRLLYAEWIAQSVNGLLPVAQIGGEVIKARMLFKDGVSGALAGASAVVDKTMQAAAQVAASLIGVALLALYAGSSAVIPAALLVTAVLGVLIFVFYHVQRKGLFPLLARFANRMAGGARLDGLIGGAGAMEASIRHFYDRRQAILAAFLGKLANRILSVAEVWLALALMDHPVSLVAALLLETLNQTMRSAAFAVPAAVGVQEGGYVVVGLLVGLPADLALALSLAKRGRELAVGLPALVAWQVVEGRLLARRRGGRE